MTISITNEVSYIGKLVTYTSIFVATGYESLRTKDMIISCLRFCISLEPIKHSVATDILEDIEKLEKTMYSLYSVNEFPEYYI